MTRGIEYLEGLVAFVAMLVFAGLVWLSLHGAAILARVGEVL